MHQKILFPPPPPPHDKIDNAMRIIILTVGSDGTLLCKLWIDVCMSGPQKISL